MIKEVDLLPYSICCLLYPFVYWRSSRTQCSTVRLAALVQSFQCMLVVLVGSSTARKILTYCTTVYTLQYYCNYR